MIKFTHFNVYASSVSPFGLQYEHDTNEHLLKFHTKRLYLTKENKDTVSRFENVLTVK